MQTERFGQPLMAAQYCDSSQHACIMHGAQAGVAPSVGSPHTGGPPSWNERSSMPTTCRHDTAQASRARTRLIRADAVTGQSVSAVNSLMQKANDLASRLSALMPNSMVRISVGSKGGGLAK